MKSIALAAPHSAAVEAADEIIEAGGNVVDAAVAAAAALTVVYPHMCSVGGDVIALLRTPDGKTTCVNASGSYGSGAVNAWPDRGPVRMPVYGPLTVTVPGAVSGWQVLLDLGGTLTAPAILAPAIRLARDGMPVAPNLARALASGRQRLQADSGLVDVFFKYGEPVGPGDIVTQPALAATLQRLADQGLSALYGEEFAGGLAALGVPISLDDLQRHQAEVLEPLTMDVAGLRVVTAPPNSQGFTLLRNLGVIAVDHDSLTDIDPALLVELLHSSDLLRDQVLADPRVVEVDVHRELTAAALHQAAANLRNGCRPDADPAPRPDGDTIAVAAIAADGTAVSLIQSIYHSFGSGLLEPSTGLVLHNRGSSFVLDPAAPNVVAPGKRPAHTLMPVLIEGPDGLIAAHGTMGGKAQSQIHTQLVQRMLEGRSAQEMVSSPRFIVGDDGVFFEGSIEGEVAARLRSTGRAVTVGAALDNSAGHSMVARLMPDGSLEAGADPRSDGRAMVRR